MKERIIAAGLLFLLVFASAELARCQTDLSEHVFGDRRDTTATKKAVIDTASENLTKAGLEIMMSGSGGLGLGFFYRHRLGDDPTWYWFVSFSIGDVKDDQEFEYYDYWTGRMVTPGKLNRFYAIPLFAGIQYRLWKDDIVDNFRPYLTAAAGPAIVYSAPFVEEEIYVAEDGSIVTFQKEVDFFKSLGKGRAYYTFGGYIGAGAFFGSLNSPIGLSARYVYLPVFGGLPSMGTSKSYLKKYNFGGFNIVLTFSF